MMRPSLSKAAHMISPVPASMIATSGNHASQTNGSIISRRPGQTSLTTTAISPSRFEQDGRRADVRAGLRPANVERPAIGFGGADSVTHSTANRAREHQCSSQDNRGAAIDVARDAERDGFTRAFHRGNDLFIQRLGTERL